MIMDMKVHMYKSMLRNINVNGKVVEGVEESAGVEVRGEGTWTWERAWAWAWTQR
jgi:hypothetical protein